MESKEYRIRILGGSSTGKTSLSKLLMMELSIDTVLHIDDIYWKPRWKETSPETLLRKLDETAKKRNTWIIDGNYTKVSWSLFRYTTHVIMMYPPLYRTFWRLFWREIIRRFPSRYFQVTPVPRMVRGDPHPYPLWKGIKILFKHSIDYYRYRARAKVEELSIEFPDIPIFVYQKSSDFDRLKRFLQ